MSYVKIESIVRNFVLSGRLPSSLQKICVVLSTILHYLLVKLLLPARFVLPGLPYPLLLSLVSLPCFIWPLPIVAWSFRPPYPVTFSVRQSAKLAVSSHSPPHVVDYMLLLHQLLFAGTGWRLRRQTGVSCAPFLS